MLACMLVAARTQRNKNKKPGLVLVRARTAVKILLTEREKSNPTPLEHFQTSATMSQCFDRTKTAVALPHSS